MKALWRGLSQLAREGDTRALELVVGLFLTTLGLQYAGVAFGLLPTPPSLTSYFPALIAMQSATMILGGILKVWGAVLNDLSLRIVGAILGAISWIYLIFLVILTASPLTTLLWVILCTQSAWIYVRLSIIQKQSSKSGLVQ